MLLSPVSMSYGLAVQLAGTAALLVVFAVSCRWFWRRWDRLTRHRFVRWHRGAWRWETRGHGLIYQDAICLCCRSHEEDE